MPLEVDPSRRHIYWFILDGIIQWDRQGWEFYCRTPLFGFCVTKYFQDFNYIDTKRVNRVWLGLVCRWPSCEGDKFYRFNWEKKWAPRLATQHTLG